MNIFFYIPKEFLPTTNILEEWNHEKKSPPIRETGLVSPTHNWICQTWALLTTAGVPCHLTTQLPSRGTIFSLSSFLHPSCKPPENVFLIDIVADGKPHPAAHLHLVQNRRQAERLSHALFMPHWPQPHLIPRDPNRGDAFETLSFFGHDQNLATELQSAQWRYDLQHDLGMRLHLPSVHEWHNYVDTDVVIAIRDFSKSRHFHKPATKLYNAWHAGVPFIGGRDSAYAADGHPYIDYLVATSPKQVMKHLQRLKEDLSFRSSFVKHGLQSRNLFTHQAILAYWKQLIEETLPALLFNK